jgi:hypothetical protein
MNKAVLHQLVELPPPIHISGTLAGDGKETKRSKITFIATELGFLAPGTQFLFSREVATNSDDESFDVDLLPGKYRIVIQPESTAYGVQELEMTFKKAASNQELSLASPISLSGAVDLPSGEPYPFLNFEIVQQPSTLVADYRRTPIPIARPASGASDAGGVFSTTLDPGTFAMTFRPSESSGYPWIIVPTVTMESGVASQIFATGSLPISLKGRVYSADVGPASSAVVRFYALLNGDVVSDTVETATRAIAIGEARADDEGNYSVLLPSRIGKESN